MKNTRVNMFIQIRWLSLVVNVNIYMGLSATVCLMHIIDMLDNLFSFNKVQV